MIDLAQKMLNWGDAPIKLLTHGSHLASVSRIGLGAELVRAELLQAGFEMTPQRAISVLSILANGKTSLRLKGWSNDRYTAKQNLHAVRDIERAVRKGLFDLPDTARQDAARIIDLMGENRHGPHGGNGPEKTDIPVMKTLRSLAGSGQQANFYTRVRNEKVQQFPVLRLGTPPQEKVAFWDDVLVEFAKLWSDFLGFKDGSLPGPNWLNDQRLFLERFGPGDGHHAFRFGWWCRDTRGETGFHESSNNWVSRIYHGEAPPEHLLTPQRTAELRTAAATMGKNWPRLYTGPGVPYLDLFAFDRPRSRGRADQPSGYRRRGQSHRRLVEGDRSACRPGRRRSLSARIRRVDQPSLRRDTGRYRPRACQRYRAICPGLSASFGQAVSRPDARGWNPGISGGCPHQRAEVHDWARARRSPGKGAEYVPWKDSAYQVTNGFSENNAAVGRGIALGLSRLPAALAVPMLEDLAPELLARTGSYGQTLTGPKGAAACVWSLGQFGTREAAEALGRVRRKTADKKTLRRDRPGNGRRGRKARYASR